jgi:hypothetical protein
VALASEKQFASGSRKKERKSLLQIWSKSNSPFASILQLDIPSPPEWLRPFDLWPKPAQNALEKRIGFEVLILTP